jgi:hypothetical protein
MMAKELFKKDDVNALRQSNRDYEYRVIGQPIFMKVQMGQATMEEFQAAIAEIDARHPFVDADFELELSDSLSINVSDEAK